MKLRLLAILLSCFCITIGNAQETEGMRYEVLKCNMPQFYEALKSQLTYPLAWGNSTITDFNEWRNQARNKVWDCMQQLPPQATDYNMEIVACEERDGYSAQKIEFNVSAWSRIPGYLLVPKGKGPFPAIVMLHDHGAHFSIGKEKMVRPFHVAEEIKEDAEQWVKKYYDNQYLGDYFAKNGYVVLAIDALFWGERGMEEGSDYDGQQALASNFLQMGTSWGAIINIDDVRSAEFLTTLPYVDSTRIGSLGFSMGAYRSWMMAALSDIVAASASVCWMNTTEYLMSVTNNQNKGGSAYSMILPGIRRYLDYPHVASIACPKPTLFFNGSQDKLFPQEGAWDAYRIMQHVWDSQQASNKLITKTWNEKHLFNRTMQKEVLDFFNRWFIF
ncbi:MAG: hypothetical protein E7099_03080 [Mediterranea massiliensis]|nr:hypothetical protein [Mediterranea massiliensis]